MLLVAPTVHMASHLLHACLQIHAIQGQLLTGSETSVLPLLQSIAQADDVFITHFGLWHGETPHAHGRYMYYLKSVGKFYEETKKSFPWQFFMETPKQHFDSADGDYKSAWLTPGKGPSPPYQCKAIPGVVLGTDGALAVTKKGNKVAEYVASGTWRNLDARRVLGGYGMPLLHIYNVTATAWDKHRRNLKGQECSHFCFPSIPQLWVYQLYKTLQERGVREVPAHEAVHRHRADISCLQWPEWV